MINYERGASSACFNEKRSTVPRIFQKIFFHELNIYVLNFPMFFYRSSNVSHHFTNVFIIAVQCFLSLFQCSRTNILNNNFKMYKKKFHITLVQ